MKKEKLKWAEMAKKQKVIHIIDCVMKSLILLIVGTCIVYGIVYNAKNRVKVARAEEVNIGTNFENLEAYFNNSTLSTYEDNTIVKTFNISKEVQEIETPMGKRIINKKGNAGIPNIMEIKRNTPYPSKRLCADIVHFCNSIYTLTTKTFVSLKIEERYVELYYDSFVMEANGANFYGLSNESLKLMYENCEKITEIYISNRSGEFGRISIPTNLVKVRNQPLEVYTYSFKLMAGNTSYKEFVGNLYNGVYATQAGYVYQNFCCDGKYGICVETTKNNIFLTGQYNVYMSDRSTEAKSFLQGVAPSPYNLIRGYNISPQQSQYLYVTGNNTAGELLSLNQIIPSFDAGNYQEGYNNGYNDGYNEGKKNATGFNPVGIMIEPIAELFNVKLFGDFSIGNFFAAALFVTLAISFMKMFAGG